MNIAYVNRAGNKNGLKFHGRSTFVSLMVNILGQLGNERGEFFIAEINREETDKARETYTYFRDLSSDKLEFKE